MAFCKVCSGNNTAFNNIMGSNSSLLSDAPPEVLTDLRCTKCDELLTCPPIMWYPKQGNVCGRCPQEAYDDGIRNTAFEALAKLQNLPCRFKNDDGCSEKLKWEQVKHHEDTCDFRNHACPTFNQSCKWNGRKGELQEHYKEKHVHLLYSKNNPILIDLHTDLTQNYYVKDMNKRFLLHVRFHSNLRKVWCGLFYFDLPDENLSYKFEIELHSKAGNTLKITAGNQYCFLPTNFVLSGTVLFEIDLNGLQLFVNNNQFLKCHVHVSTENIKPT